jgi:MFS family permease
MFGDQISSIAMPLAAVLVLKAGAAEMGYLTALLWLPSLLFGVHAGAWVDRHGHRRASMIAADLGRFALLATVPVAYALGALTLPQLFTVAFGTGVLSILFNVADSTLFVSLVPADRYVEGNSLIYGSRAFSFVGGPSMGGLLVQWLMAPFAIAADALSFLGSAVLLWRVRAEEPPPAGPADGALAAGARFIAASPVIRACLCAAAMINLFTFAMTALFVLYAVRTLHVNPGLLGLVLGAGAVGGLVGATAAKRLSAALGLGRTTILGCIMFTLPLLLVPLAGGPRPVVLGMLFTAEFASGVGVMVFDISLGSIFAAVIPDVVRARVMGAFQAVNYGTRPIGALAAGGLATMVGVRPTLWLAAGGAALGFLWLLPLASGAAELS